MDVEILLNGAPRRFPSGTTVAELVAALDLVPEQVAVELNRSIVRRAVHGETVLGPGDAVEVVTLVGGG